MIELISFDTFPNFDFELIYTFRDGKVTRAEGFRTPQEALAAAGLA